MSIVMGVDQHRAQITAEWIDLETGEISRARVRPADRAGVRRFLARFAGQQLEVALEATTGWRFFVEELRAVGAVVHLAEPAETAARRGRKKRPKTDRADARHHRELLLAGRLPESWIPPDHILDLRAQVRLRHTLGEQRSEWQQRIQAVLYHHGCPQRRRLMTAEGRDWLEALVLPEAARQQITVARAMVDALDAQLAPLTKELCGYARRQIGCRALIEAHHGIGGLCAVTILAELGDVGRFDNSRDAVRYGGMDITVYQSDRHRSPGHLSRQGPPALRWALYEAAQAARRPGSPDRDRYLEAAERLGGNRACLALARKLLKRCYHTLRGLGADALQPPVEQRPGSGAARRASSGGVSRLERPATNERTDELAA
ncbi:MAG TPA: IS110 family transposase [Solirubrobacteraceae bacterium]|jgi:transposase|nr:IS110 family transposase [Solirubrobacteraceae bacterium]